MLRRQIRFDKCTGVMNSDLSSGNSVWRDIGSRHFFKHGLSRKIGFCTGDCAA